MWLCWEAWDRMYVCFGGHGGRGEVGRGVGVWRGREHGGEGGPL